MVRIFEFSRNARRDPQCMRMADGIPPDNQGTFKGNFRAYDTILGAVLDLEPDMSPHSISLVEKSMRCPLVEKSMVIA